MDNKTVCDNCAFTIQQEMTIPVGQYALYANTED